MLYLEEPGNVRQQNARYEALEPFYHFTEKQNLAGEERDG